MKRALCLLFALVMLFSLGAQALAEDALFCRICGKQIPSDSNVCPYCGEKVVTVEQANVKTALSGTNASPAATSDSKTPVVIERISSPSPITTNGDPGPFNSGSSSFGTVRVTKSPTSENVVVGGSCMFIAHAANAKSVTWYISTSDGSIIAAADAPSRFSGLRVSGANSDTLTLSNVPSSMNGCRVQACFTGEGGPVYSGEASIWTYQAQYTSSNDNDKNCRRNKWWWDFWRVSYWRNYYWYDRWYDRPSAAPRGFHPETTTQPATVEHISHYDPLHPDQSWDLRTRGLFGLGAEEQPMMNAPDPMNGAQAAAQPGPTAAPADFNPGGGTTVVTVSHVVNEVSDVQTLAAETAPAETAPAETAAAEAPAETAAAEATAEVYFPEAPVEAAAVEAPAAETTPEYSDYTPEYSDYTPEYSDYTPEYSDYSYTPEYSDYTPDYSDYSYTPEYSDYSPDYSYTPDYSDYSYTPDYSSEVSGDKGSYGADAEIFFPFGMFPNMY